MWIRIIAAATAFTLAGLAADSFRSTNFDSTPPPVLRSSEPVDSRVVTLPGLPAQAAPPVAVAETELSRPQLAPSPAPALFPRAAVIPAPVSVPVSVPPPPTVLANVPKAPKPTRPASVPNPAAISKLIFPLDFERDSAAYCQKRIGEWTEPDVYNLFGDP